MSKVQGFSEVQMQQMAQMVAMTISQVMPQKKQPMAQKLTSGNLIGCSVVESYCFVVSKSSTIKGYKSYTIFTGSGDRLYLTHRDVLEQGDKMAFTLVNGKEYRIYSNTHKGYYKVLSALDIKNNWNTKHEDLTQLVNNQ
jgi:hypothetical protein